MSQSQNSNLHDRRNYFKIKMTDKYNSVKLNIKKYRRIVHTHTHTQVCSQ